MRKKQFKSSCLERSCGQWALGQTQKFGFCNLSLSQREANENRKYIRATAGGTKIRAQWDVFSHLMSKWVLNVIPNCSS